MGKLGPENLKIKINQIKSNLKSINHFPKKNPISSLLNHSKIRRRIFTVETMGHGKWKNGKWIKEKKTIGKIGKIGENMEKMKDGKMRMENGKMGKWSENTTCISSDVSPLRLAQTFATLSSGLVSPGP